MDGGGIYTWILKFSVQKIMEGPEGGSEGWGLVEVARGGVLCLQENALWLGGKSIPQYAEGPNGKGHLHGGWSLDG